jgi:signal transduction histidine kinase
MPPATADVLPILSQKVDEMSSLVEQMLEVARLEEGRTNLKFVESDLRDLVRDAVAEARRLTAGSAHRIESDVPEQPVRATVDGRRFGTILTNLLSNAIKYSPEGGLIRCSLQVRHGKAVVKVSDQGLGIEAEHMDRLFTRFGRIITPLTSGIPGTGLGLFLSRELARLHGGDITVTSEPGKGSEFTFTLPIPAG